jgi:hypothetical protein
MRIACLLLALTACHKGGGDDYPVLPGGDDVVIMPGVDAPAGSDGTLGDGPMLTARVCVLDDLRTPGVCKSVGAAGYTVTLGTSTATTADDGSFTIATPPGTNLVWRASGADIVSSVIRFSTSPTVPAITTQYYEDLKGSNGIIINSGEASIVLFVSGGSLALSGATATVNAPAIAGPSLHDTNARLNWPQGATGAAGIAWIPNVSPGTDVVTVAAPQQTSQMVTLEVEDQAISFATVAFP